MKPFIDRFFGTGSSPRVRGGVFQAESRASVLGCIPARVGWTSAASCSTRPYQVHPRACGAARSNAAQLCAGVGSSPRVRGSFYESADLERLMVVHPRACGVPSRGVAVITVAQGASPRARGGSEHASPDGGRRGASPRGGGEASRPVSLHPVHPRACGATSLPSPRPDGVDRRTLAPDWRRGGPEAEGATGQRRLRCVLGFPRSARIREEPRPAIRYWDSTAGQRAAPGALSAPSSTGQVALAVPLAEAPWAADEEEPHPAHFRGFPPGARGL